MECGPRSCEVVEFLAREIPAESLVAFQASDTTRRRVWELDTLVPVTFQWQKAPSANGPYVDIPVTNATAIQSVLKIPEIHKADEGFYRVVVTSCGGKTFGEPCDVKILEPPQILRQPGDIAHRECERAELSVAAIGCQPFSYQWFFKGQPIFGATSSNLVFSSISSNNAGITNYWVVVSNTNGFATSRLATVTVDPLPHITRLTGAPLYSSSPLSVRVRDCTNATFTLTADDNCNRPIGYQWLFKGTGGATLAPLVRPGTVTAASNLVILNTHPNDDGEYRVRVSSIGGTITSAPVRLIINAYPLIRAQPLDAPKVKLGDPLTLKIDAESCTPIRWQWYSTAFTNTSRLTIPSTLITRTSVETNVVTITDSSSGSLKTYFLTNYYVTKKSSFVTSLSAVPGASGPIYSVPAAAVSDIGTYLVTLTNAYSSTNSRLATVTVYVRPPNDNFTNAILIPGTNALVTGHNFFATAETNEPAHIGTNSPPLLRELAKRSVWYRWTAPEDPGFLNLDSRGSSLRTVLAVYTNAPLNARRKLNWSEGTFSERASLTNIGLTDLTTVYVAVDGRDGEEENFQMRLNYIIVTNPPVIVKHPEDIAVKRGSNATFTVVHEANPAVSYFWKFNGNFINPAQNPTAVQRTLLITNVTEKEEGGYSVVLTNKYATNGILSQSARLRIGAILQGFVRDANNTNAIFEALVQAPGRTNLITEKTDTNGFYRLVGVTPGDCTAQFDAHKRVVGLNEAVRFFNKSTVSAITLHAEHPGYYDYDNTQVDILEGNRIEYPFAMSPRLTNGMRFVLTWGLLMLSGAIATLRGLVIASDMQSLVGIPGSKLRTHALWLT